MRFIYLIVFLTLTFQCEAQICNFCNYENVKEMMKDEGMPFTEKMEMNGEKLLKSCNKIFIKTWHFKYDKCFLYEIQVFKESYSKSLVEILNKDYARLSDSSWESNENRVELLKAKNYRKFSFYSKPSVLNGILIN